MPMNNYQKMLNDALMILSQVWVRGESVDYLAGARSMLTQLYDKLADAVPKSGTKDKEAEPDGGQDDR